MRLRIRTELAASILVALCASPARGQTQQAAFAGSTSTNRVLGWSVSLSGDFAVAGAPGPHGSALSEVRVYHRSGATWTEEQVLAAAGGAAGDWWGTDVALDDGVVAAGGWGVSDGDDDEPGVHRGAVAVFRRTGGSPLWTEETRLQPRSALEHDRFGGAVDLDGDLLAVGAPGADDLGAESGAVYVFRHTGGVWLEEARLTAFDGGAQQRFGCDVALSGDTLAIGASGTEETAGFAGAAYVFHFDGIAWGLQARLAPASGARDDRFGAALDLLDDVLAVAAPRETVDGTPKAGTVRIFRRNGASWAEEALLRAVAPALTDNFGSAIDLGAGQIVIGVPGDDGFGAQAGRVDRFVHDRGAWLAATGLTGTLVDSADEFGRAVAVDGIHAIVGAPNARDVSGFWGRAYLFGGLVGGSP